MSSKLLYSVMLFCSVFSFTSGLSGQEGGAGGANETNLPPAKIVNVSCVAQGEECYVYNSIDVEVENLSSWRDANKLKLNPDRLLLVLNGVVLKGDHLFGRRFASKSGAGREILRFDLDKSRHTARGEWRDLMGRVKAYMPTAMSLGLTSETVDAAGGAASHRLYWDEDLLVQAAPVKWFIIAVVSFLALLVVFCLLARYSDVLRAAPTPSGRKPLSLGRLQMAWWFFIVVGSFVYIFVVLGDYSALNGSVLTLIGISAATGFVGASLDTTKKVLAGETTQEKITLEAEQKLLTAGIASLDGQISATPPRTNLADLQAERASKQLRLGEINARLAKIAGQRSAAQPAASSSLTGGGYLDIFREGDGISFHRFQIVVWSIVLGVVFMNSVWTNLSMPDFDPNLLGLMGISSGTYVGFKFPSAGGSDGQ